MPVNIACHSLPPQRLLVNLIYVSLTCEDGNSKLVDIGTVANVDDEDCIGNSLLQIWELRIVHKAKLLFRLWAQPLVKILSSSLNSGKIWSWSLVGILLLMFCRGYEVESWSRFWTRFWILSLVEMLMFGWNFEVDAWSRFWRWNLIKICVWIRDMTSRSYFGKMNSILGSVVPLAMFSSGSSAHHLTNCGQRLLWEGKNIFPSLFLLPQIFVEAHRFVKLTNRNNFTPAFSCRWPQPKVP